MALRHRLSLSPKPLPKRFFFEVEHTADLDRDPHRNLVRLNGSPALTALDMVDTIPAYDGPNPSSCFVFSG